MSENANDIEEREKKVKEKEQKLEERSQKLLRAEGGFAMRAKSFEGRKSFFKTLEQAGIKNEDDLRAVLKAKQENQEQTTTKEEEDMVDYSDIEKKLTDLDQKIESFAAPVKQQSDFNKVKKYFDSNIDEIKKHVPFAHSVYKNNPDTIINQFINVISSNPDEDPVDFLKNYNEEIRTLGISSGILKEDKPSEELKESKPGLSIKSDSSTSNIITEKTSQQKQKQLKDMSAEERELHYIKQSKDLDKEEDE